MSDRFGYIEQIDGSLIHRRKGKDDVLIARSDWIKVKFEGPRQSGRSTCLNAASAVFRDSGAEVIEIADHEIIVVHGTAVLNNIRSF